MKIIELGKAIEPAMPLLISLYWYIFRDRSGYFGFDYEKPWIRQTPLRVVMPVSFIILMLFIGYCTYLNNWV